MYKETEKAHPRSAKDSIYSRCIMITHIKESKPICKKCAHFFPSFTKLTMGSCYNHNPSKQVSYQETCKDFIQREAEI